MSRLAWVGLTSCAFVILAVSVVPVHLAFGLPAALLAAFLTGALGAVTRWNS